jgi:hypothetical protein
MKKIVKLTESDLRRIVNRVLMLEISDEDAKLEAEKMLKNGPKPSESGAVYCFTKDLLVREIKNVGPKNLFLYKIKKGNAYSGIEAMTDQVEALKTMNPRCDLKKNLRANDVILISSMPGY